MKIIAATVLCLASLAVPAAFGDPAISRASNDFNRAVVDLNEIETQCYAARETLQPGIFKGLELSAEQVRTTLSYFYYRNLAKCTEAAVSNLVLKGAILASLNPEIAGDIADGNALITHPHVSAIKRETEYMLLPVELRKNLDSIEALKNPFDLMSSGDLLVPLKE